MLLILSSLLLIAAVCTTQRTYAESEITALVPFDVQRDLMAFAAGRDLLQITEFGGPHTRRDVVEVVLFYQALHLGGFRGHVRELPVPEGNYPKIGGMLRQGRTALVANSAWLEAIDAQTEDVWVTEALIDNGEFSVGIYARADRKIDLKAALKQQPSSLSAVSTANWLVDWRELQRLNLGHIYDRSLWPDMVAMVGSGSADLLLAPFTEPLAEGIRVGSHHITPVNGVKLTLPGSRHWVASKRHPMGKIGFAFLQRGLLKLQQRGIIAKAYRQSGFMTESVADWTDLYRPESIAESHSL